MDSKCACAATAVRCRKSTLVIVNIHRSIKKSPFTRFKNFAHQWIALFFLFNFILSLLLSNHIFVIECPTNMKHIWSGQHILLTFLSEELQKNRYKKVSLKLCQKLPPYLPEYSWKIQLQPPAAVGVRPIFVLRCLASEPPPAADAGNSMICSGASWLASPAAEAHLMRTHVWSWLRNCNSSSPEPLPKFCGQ